MWTTRMAMRYSFTGRCSSRCIARTRALMRQAGAQSAVEIAPGGLRRFLGCYTTGICSVRIITRANVCRELCTTPL